MNLLQSIILFKISHDLTIQNVVCKKKKLLTCIYDGKKKETEEAICKIECTFFLSLICSSKYLTNGKIGCTPPTPCDPDPLDSVERKINALCKCFLC